MDKLNNLLQEDNPLKYYSRPETSYDPPSVETIMLEWEKDMLSIPFKDDDGLDHLCFKKDDKHIYLHRCHQESTKYKVAFVLSDSSGFIYFCDCYSNEKAAQMYIMGGMIVFSGILGY